MDRKMSKQITSAGSTIDLTIDYSGVNDETIMARAFNFDVWKVQRVVRDASESQRATWARDGLVLHANDVGKPIKSVEEMIDGLTPEQLARVIEYATKKAA